MKFVREESILRQLIIHVYKKIFAKKRINQYPICLKPRGNVKGTVLFSYLPSPLLWSVGNSKFSGHSANWESRQIAHTFISLGYSVDAVKWNDLGFIPQKNYDIVFDICYNLGRLAPYYSDNTLKLLHCTGSDPYFQNQAESQRVKEVNLRKNGHYSPKRLVSNPELNYLSLDIADEISLLGNKDTVATYPEVFQKKMSLVPVSASPTRIKTKPEFFPCKREFLWFFGGGAVHKGLDLVLEAFSRHPEYKLHIVGNAGDEKDFLEMYARELFDLPNIHYHGYLKPDTTKFYSLLANTFSFIAPSCSEGISTAVVTCLQMGLFPILSANTGVSLPQNCGIYLNSLCIEQIEDAIKKAYEMDKDSLMMQIEKCQQYAKEIFSREAFSMKIREFLETAINNHKNTNQYVRK